MFFIALRRDVEVFSAPRPPRRLRLLTTCRPTDPFAMSSGAAASSDPNGSVESKANQVNVKGTAPVAEDVGDGVAAKVSAVIAANDGGLMKQIEALKKAQADARKSRQLIARDLRNAQRRKRRLKSKARMLSNDDLVAVLMMRKETAPAPEPTAPTEPFAVVGEAVVGGDDDDEISPPSPKAARIED